MEKSTVSQAVRELRQSFGESQQAFAYRTKTAIRTIARYETVRPPRGAELGQFLKLAIENELPAIASVFAGAIGDELSMKAERIPRTVEESICADLLFLMMRNRHLQESGKSFALVRDTLLEGFEYIAEQSRSGNKVLGLDPDDREIFEGEVSDLKRGWADAEAHS